MTAGESFIQPETEMEDFVLISPDWMLDRKVNTYDAAGNLVPDDGEYRHTVMKSFMLLAISCLTRAC